MDYFKRVIITSSILPASDRRNEYPRAFSILFALRSEQALISLFLIEVGTPIFNDSKVACTSTFLTIDTGVIFLGFSLGVTIIINIFENRFNLC